MFYHGLLAVPPISIIRECAALLFEKAAAVLLHGGRSSPRAFRRVHRSGVRKGGVGFVRKADSFEGARSGAWRGLYGGA